MKSLTETNSGKLITLISSDIFALERPFAMAPFFFASPFINIACYLRVWQISGWYYAIIMAGIWVITFLLQFCSARIQRGLK